MERYKLLFSKYLSNSCTKEELNEIINWIKDSDNDQQLKNLITKDWSSFDFHTTHDTVDHNKFIHLLNEIENEEQFRNKISYQKNKKLKKKKSLTYIFTRIAATFLLPVILGVSTFFLINKINESKRLPVLNTITVPNGSKTQIVLSDSTIIWLNSGSSITYPSVFTNKSREVRLIGEGYFEVTKNLKKPFIVKTSDIDIKVLGTKFNLKSYPEEGTIETTLLEGSVAICKNNKEYLNNQIVLLKPNERATYIKKSGRVIQGDVEGENQSEEINETEKRKEQLVLSTFSDAEEFTSWKDEKLVFRNENFEDICVKMERWYNVQINIHSEALKNYHYTGTLQNENIVDAIKAFQITLPLRYEINHDVIDVWLHYK